MFRLFQGRAGHHLLLVAVCAALYLPNLGGPSLWDIDEGNNSGCSRGDARLGRLGGAALQRPVAQGQAGPALLAAGRRRTRLFGVNEFARPPAVGAGGAGRRPADLRVGPAAVRPGDGPARRVGPGQRDAVLRRRPLRQPRRPARRLHGADVPVLLAGVQRGSRWWLVAAGAAAGLGVLAKGPVAVVVPWAAPFLFLLWSRRLGLLRDRRVLWGTLACAPGVRAVVRPGSASKPRRSSCRAFS